MNKIVLTGLTALAAISTVAGTANAQSTNVEKPITIKLGAYFPSSGSVKDSSGNTQFAAGAEYQVGKSVSAIPTVPLLYVDYDGASKSGGHQYTTGVGVGVKQYLGGGPEASTTPYVGAGVGAYFDEVRLDGASENKTNVGYKLDAGLEFNHSELIEVDYQDAGSVHGERLNGVDVLLGYRF